jgi:hypothetical protein
MEPVDTVQGMVAASGWELAVRTEALPGLQGFAVQPAAGVDEEFGLCERPRQRTPTMRRRDAMRGVRVDPVARTACVGAWRSNEAATSFCASIACA